MRVAMADASGPSGWVSVPKFGTARVALKQREALQSRLIYIACFSVFLLAAIIGRLKPWGRQRSDHRKSIFGEAKAAASTVLPFVFMA